MYRSTLPQLGGEVFLTDSGLETDLIFHQGFDLPQFAAFVLLGDTCYGVNCAHPSHFGPALPGGAIGARMRA